MKNFFGKLFGNTQKKLQNSQKSHDCKHHNFERFPSIKSNEECLDCGIKMCYMCGNQHIERKCTINWGKAGHFKNFDFLESSNVKLLNYNKGFLALLRLDDLICKCGEKIGINGKGGICVACSNAVCSKECHSKYAEETNTCVFQTNFTKKLPELSMISIVFKNVTTLYEKPYPIGIRLSKTSPAFVKAFAARNTNEIYLQRGYRQYGYPLEQTIRNLEVIDQINLDFIMNSNRKCYCECGSCNLRSRHPVKNCSFECKNSDELSITELFKRDDFLEECDCSCKFCKSGITVNSHRKEDCFYYCEQNSVKKNGF